MVDFLLSALEFNALLRDPGRKVALVGAHGKT